MSDVVRAAGENVEAAKKVDEDAYQKFLDFLGSPVWILPVMTFLEQKSLAFDNKDLCMDNYVYQEIHRDYRNLVDNLIQSFCDDAQITVKSLVDTLKSSRAVRAAGGVAATAPPTLALERKTSTKMTASFDGDYSLLEPVLAASDYDLFVHIMIKKNIDLQLQALQIIEVMCGVMPDTLSSLKEFEKSAGNLSSEDQERLILVQVIKQSLADFETDKKNDEAETLALQRALRESMQEKKRLEIERQNEESLIRATLKLSLDEKVTMKEFLIDANSIAPAVANMEEEKPQEEIRSAKENSPQNQKDLQLRRQYLMKQRDKLLTMKKEAREKVLDEMITDGRASVSKRPRSAKVARMSMKAGGGGRNGGAGVNSGLNPTPNVEVIAARRELMKKIKHEVMGP